jgi:hypothetical protein
VARATTGKDDAAGGAGARLMACWLARMSVRQEVVTTIAEARKLMTFVSFSVPS